MQGKKTLGALAALTGSVAALAGTQLAAGRTAAAPAAAPAKCALGNTSGAIKHVVYLQFDNTHYLRDKSSVASDLEQMPHLLNFLKSNGTLFTNDHTILISHTAGGILSTQTGLYPDRHGVNVSNSYFYFPPTKVPAFSSAFKYWTDLVDDSTGTKDALPNMVTDHQKTTPAPWVPFTRAGCDFGAVSLANIELENTGTGPFGDMSQVFGTGSRQWNEAVASNAAPSGTAARAKALTDFVGIAVHCGNGGGICTSNATNTANSRPDNLPDEPGGYAGYQGLFGAKYVNPAVCSPQPSTCSSVMGQAAVNNTFGQPVTDQFGQPGFPGFDGALATNTLGYLAQMQEAGIPVTWGYISDAHDNHTLARASGPGEADYQAQLKAYDDAFAAFFDRLKADGIDKSNTLFMVTVDEGDRFAGGIGIPQGDGTLAYSHTNCAWTTTPACPTNQIGEVNLNIKPMLPAGTPSFVVHNDSAPTFYVNGQPAPTDPTLRKLERDVGSLTAIDPYASSDAQGEGQSGQAGGQADGGPARVFVRLADPIEELTLHMANSDPARTPTFTAFGNPDYFITAASSGPSCGSNPCIDYHFAWSHGDVQPEIGTTWVGFVGPGIDRNGIDSSTWTDHTNVRPTMLSLLGLSDDYLHDGRVLVEALDKRAIPKQLDKYAKTTLELGAVYEQLNAPFGKFAMDTLTASTTALLSSDEGRYTSIENSIQSLTSKRDELATTIKKALDGAAFNDQSLSKADAEDWISQAENLLDRASELASGP